MMTTQATENIVHNTFVIERNYPRRPEKVFAAFAQPDRKRRWYAEGKHEIQEFAMDFRVGGSEKFRYRFREGHPIAGSKLRTRGFIRTSCRTSGLCGNEDVIERKDNVVTLATWSLWRAGDRDGLDPDASGSVH